MTDRWNTVDGYVIRPELQYAVEAALTLRKPLLLRGESGTGKTSLAQAAARVLNRPLLIWDVKSNTQARHGWYHYDSTQRLYDSQFLPLSSHTSLFQDPMAYLRLGPLGQAFTANEPVVLLIDGIDQADLDFPTDLLWELEQEQFQIQETGAILHAHHSPLILFTSNGEKELPPAFLRRCLFHVLSFPKECEMRTIIAAQSTLSSLAPALLDRALEVFYWMRSLTTLQKKPSTSELLDWLHALTLTGAEPTELPYLGTLLKWEGDWAKVRQYWKGRTRYVP